MLTSELKVLDLGNASGDVTDELFAKALLVLVQTLPVAHVWLEDERLKIAWRLSHLDDRVLELLKLIFSLQVHFSAFDRHMAQ